MTVPEERTLAVLQTRIFLQELANAPPKNRVPEAVRQEAIRLLRHYPAPSHLELAHLHAPGWFGPVRGFGT
ncbi:BPSL0761 family protein [Hydrogenophaga sp.]|uniref:BPSL0761 family protein n=1 Tax=Hydrogenophaga sp. TaxID=1904254 RepID=UPI00351D7F32